MSKTTPFDISDFLPYLLNQAAETASLQFQKHYKERYGMLRTEWRVLFHLGKYEHMTASEISIASKTHKTKISRAVQALHDKQMVVRIADGRDRRREMLELTKQGKVAYAQLCEVAAGYEAELTSSISDGEMKALRSALKKIAERAP